MGDVDCYQADFGATAIFPFLCVTLSAGQVFDGQAV